MIVNTETFENPPYHSHTQSLLEESERHFVLKLSGKTFLDTDKLRNIISEAIDLAIQCHRKIVFVHGAGSQFSDKIGERVLDDEGDRITLSKHSATLQSVDEKLSKKLRKEIKEQRQNSVIVPPGTITGIAKGKIEESKKETLGSPDEEEEINITGKSFSLTKKAIKVIRKNVFSIVGHVAFDSENDIHLNGNADLIAAKVASSIDAEKLILFGSTDGLYNKSGKTIKELDCSLIENYLNDGTISGPAIPKAKLAKSLIEKGINVHFLSDSIKKGTLHKIFKSGEIPMIGTTVTSKSMSNNHF